jgi:hypothetical protein
VASHTDHLPGYGLQQATEQEVVAALQALQGLCLVHGPSRSMLSSANFVQVRSGQAGCLAGWLAGCAGLALLQVQLVPLAGALAAGSWQCMRRWMRTRLQPPALSGPERCATLCCSRRCALK